MKYKITLYLLKTKIKFIFLTVFLISLFIQIINLIEVSRVLDSDQFNMFSILYLSFLKLPSSINQILPFAIIISTAFFYRHLISNNEFISIRNVGYSIIDIFKPIGFAIFSIGMLFLIILNPLAAFSEKKFESITSKDLSSLYSIKIKNNEIWIKNIENKKTNFIKFSKFDLKNMTAEKIKIIEVNKDNKKFYSAKKGKINNNKLFLKDVYFIDINSEKTNILETIDMKLNFNNDDIINSISNYKHIPFYKYNKHTESLKKFNLYSQEVSLFYFSEIFKPFFLIILGFVVMGFASKFKRNENFFKTLFISILIGFIFFIFNEILAVLTISNYLSFLFAYTVLILVSLLIGLYQSINIEVN
tara:strand:+ start:53 stop:1132 length:1080 start_codon:yes stop_codon:yes gene_type:complete